MQVAVTPDFRPKAAYANDGSYESVKAMLQKLARTFYSRVLAMGLPMEYEDVLQECNVAYVKALKKWTPDKARFTTYCYTVVRNEFNRAIERMELDRANLGLGSIDDIGTDGEDEEIANGYERYLSAEAQGADPLELMTGREELRARLAGLTPATRRLMVALIVAERDAEKMPSLRDMARHMGLRGDALYEVQLEIARVFGVTAPLGVRKKPAEQQ